MILIFTGNGKGKTTAAIGQAIRALGRDKKVIMLQFIKGTDYPTGEDAVIAKLDNFELIKGGKGFVGILGDKLPFEEHKKAAQDTLEKAREAVASRAFDMVILDEINVAVTLELVDQEQVFELVGKIPKDMDLIITGRGASVKFVEKADLVTYFQDVKHPFYEGAKHKKGVEY